MFGINKIKGDIRWLKEDVEALQKRMERFRNYEKLFFQVMEDYEKKYSNIRKDNEKKG